MKKTIGFFVFPSVHMLDVTAPWEVFSAWSRYQDIQCLMFAETASPVQSSSGITFTPSHHIHNLPKLDAILVPGGTGVTEVCTNQEVLDKLREECSAVEEVLSVCAGTYILQAAGLLGGRKTATYWRARGELEAAGVNICEERIVEDSGLWSSGGVTSGLDMALAYVAAKAGEEVAGKVQLTLEYFPPTTNFATKELAKELPEYPRRLGKNKGEVVGSCGERTRELPRYLLESYFKGQ